MKKVLIIVLAMVLMFAPLLFACDTCGCSGSHAEVAGEGSSHDAEHMAEEGASHGEAVLEGMEEAETAAEAGSM